MKRTGMILVVMAVMLGLSIAPGVSADTRNPYLKPDETWISISGTAVDTSPLSFLLDYGEGVITVEMDGWAWYDKDFQVIEGDRVTVYGKIDDDLYETTTIEASSVYDENLGTYFYANPNDEALDEEYDYWITGNDVVLGEMTVRGTVTSVNGREFTIDTGPRKMTVDTSTMPYNPMDDKGYLRVDKGDYVSVNGAMEDGFWEGRELMADRVIIIEKG